MRRMILIPTLIVVAILAIAGGILYYFYQNYLYYRTDDAQVTGTIVPVLAVSNGQLTSFTVKQGDKVTSGQTIATITPPAVAGPSGGVSGTGGTGAPSATARPAPIDIISPLSGTVLLTPVVQGQTVAAGVTLAQVTDLNALTVTANVDENALNNVKLNQDVDIHVDAYSDTTFTGKVQRVVQATAGSFSLIPTQDTTSSNYTKVGQRIPVIISLDGTGGKDLVPGMSAEVTIHIH